MSENKPFPMNAWYAAAWGHEIKHAARGPHHLRQGYRSLPSKSGGEVAALEDACWHRLLPLSLGRLQGDQVVCGYHGLIFNAAGPLHLHAGPEDDQSVGLRARLSAIEQHRLVWVWPGDPALADPALVPDFHWNDGTDWPARAAPIY